MKTVLASLFAASLLVATAPTPADAAVGIVVHVGGHHHHRHHVCGGWGWHHHARFCRRWYWR
ncbi:MAG: hypothetical protein ACREMY_30165 [bacterium]